MMNTMTLAAALLRWSGGGALLRAAPRWDGFLILNYHRIGNAAESPFARDIFGATAEHFDRQIAFLKSAFDVISPGDISAMRRRGDGRALLITFDDGYRDNYELAFPVLARHGVPATFFLCTGFLDRGGLAWWDEIAWMIRNAASDEIPVNAWFDQRLPLRDAAEREAAIQAVLKLHQQLPSERTHAFLTSLGQSTGTGRCNDNVENLWMTWDMAREMRDAGMTIGAHTDTHPVLARLPVPEQEREIVTSRDRIAAELGEAPKAFAYPVGAHGSYDGSTKRVLQSAEFNYGFNFLGGRQPFAPFDPYDVRRAHVGHRMSLPMLQAMVTLPAVFAR